jgi:hypothetical protein
MQVNYSDQEVILARKSIFLAGPTPRDEAVHSWRPYAIKLLREMGFDGVVYVPEYSTGEVLHNYDSQIAWEWKALDNAGAILFWVPRNLETMPAYTTNVEFGYWVRDDRAFYCRPSSAVLVRYLDSLYKRHHKDRLVYTDLHSLCGRCCDYLQWKTSK